MSSALPRRRVAPAVEIPADAVTFYRASERPYGAMSNLYRREIRLHGWAFATNEHAYQFLKPREARVRDWLMSAPSPSLLAIAAHVLPSPQEEGADTVKLMQQVGNALLGFHTRPGWSRLRYPWMMEVIDAKYDQHADLAQLLLSTEGKMIVEAGRIDDDAGRRWGIVNGRGSNYLGRMKMLKRAKLGGQPYEDAELMERIEAGRESLEVALRDAKTP